MSRQIIQPDRRRLARERAEIQVQYESVDELFSEFTRDINEGGVFVATPNASSTLGITKTDAARAARTAAG